MIDEAEAGAHKRFFIDLITRDINLEDAVLDLIDNSINSILISEEISLPDKYSIDISFTNNTFELKDNCGGISYQDAKQHVFRFGRSASAGRRDTLSVYGIGLKRALFKLGNNILVSSRRDESAFRVAFSASEWERSDRWKLPLERLNPTELRGLSTHIRVEGLHEEISERILNENFDTSLRERILQTYCFFIGRFCKIRLNGKTIDAQPISLGTGEGLVPSTQRVEENNVITVVVGGLAPRQGPRNGWETERAGWYIFCNGRAVVYADRTKLSGWGIELPLYVSKYRGFLGLVFFFSLDPERLPWTTTKTDINEESLVYQRARGLMRNAANPVLRFLSSLYGSDEVESVQAKSAVEAVRAEPIRKGALQPSTFNPPRGGRQEL